MKRSLLIFLQAAVVALGIGVAGLLLWEPQIEGVNAHATNFEIYFQDPFIALVYTGSIAFFVGLYQAFRALGYVRQNKTFSRATLKALRAIKYCAITTIGFALLEEAFIILNHGNDDAAGGIFMGGLVIFGSAMVVAAASAIVRTLQNAIRIKSENDLTV